MGGCKRAQYPYCLFESWHASRFVNIEQPARFVCSVPRQPLHTLILPTPPGSSRNKSPHGRSKHGRKTKYSGAVKLKIERFIGGETPVWVDDRSGEQFPEEFWKKSAGGGKLRKASGSWKTCRELFWLRIDGTMIWSAKVRPPKNTWVPAACNVCFSFKTSMLSFEASRTFLASELIWPLTLLLSDVWRFYYTVELWYIEFDIRVFNKRQVLSLSNNGTRYQHHNDNGWIISHAESKVDYANRHGNMEKNAIFTCFPEICTLLRCWIFFCTLT